ncbi:MAG: LON peptidase substrate-binding domain-containing protein [Sedimenticolaceae bacterium]|nr:LON peptidase substrate-binding domain-containing protein [Sedimenticolaceae bacterium]
MKPRYPLIQPFDKLPEKLPIYTLENALLPGGELPLELQDPADLALFLAALKADQLIGMVQPRRHNQEERNYQTGCAGRIRQYRERKDGRLNVMLTGVCRYRIVEELPHKDGYNLARVEWSGFENDYETETVDPEVIKGFKQNLRDYFDRNRMQVDWEVLDKLPVEQVVNNLVLVLNLDIDSKQRLLESPTVSHRLELFSNLIDEKVVPLRSPLH